MPCSHCHAENIVARGLCGACYQRKRTNGSLTRKRVQNIGLCSEPGCGDSAVCKGLCHTHYSRVQHPLKNTWKLIRSRYPGKVPKSWDAFQSFIDDIGERPTRRHQLRRIDESLPYSKSNIRWIQPITKPDGMLPEDRSEYSHIWNLRSRFGMSKADYDRMLADQGGVCAICGNGQSHNGKKGAPTRLGVDHCHATGNVRGLLCVACNRMLGYAKDNPKFLDAGSAYLRRG